MLPTEYRQFDGLALSALLQGRQVSARQLMVCAIELARERATALNALCYERYEESIDLAANASLQGVFGAAPFLLKDSSLASRRFPYSLGSRLFQGPASTFDSTLVRRFAQGGFIPFARTAVPELCMAPTTEAVRNHGPTLNPWDQSRSSGGSSGGAGVAVATGVVPIAHGSDGGGSIRIPAACCGLYGLKPSRGRVPMGPARGEGWGGLSTDGVLSRTVRDSAAALDVMGGYDPGAPYAAPSAPASFLQLLYRPLERPLRIARWSGGWEGIAVASDCVAATEFAARLLRANGHEVIDVPLPEIDYWKFIEAHLQVLSASIVVAVDAVTQGRPAQEWRDRLEAAMYDGYQLGRALPAEQYVRAINLFHSVGRMLEQHMERVDLVLSPTLTQLPAKLGVFTMSDDYRSFRRKVAQYTAFLAIINASGQPAASVPLYWTDAGLPVGIQLIGHFGREDQILRLSAQLEAAAPWIGRYTVDQKHVASP
jgi:amidase